jgi:hypothetical protein
MGADAKLIAQLGLSFWTRFTGFAGLFPKILFILSILSIHSMFTIPRVAKKRWPMLFKRKRPLL